MYDVPGAADVPRVGGISVERLVIFESASSKRAVFFAEMAAAYGRHEGGLVATAERPANQKLQKISLVIICCPDAASIEIIP